VAHLIRESEKKWHIDTENFHGVHRSGHRALAVVALKGESDDRSPNPESRHMGLDSRTAARRADVERFLEVGRRKEE
jgi:hypothetical protein